MDVTQRPSRITLVRVAAILIGFAMAAYAASLQTTALHAIRTACLVATGAGTMTAFFGMIHVALGPRVPCPQCHLGDHIHQEPQEARKLIAAIITGGVLAIPGFVGLAVSTLV